MEKLSSKTNKILFIIIFTVSIFSCSKKPEKIFTNDLEPVKINNVKLLEGPFLEGQKRDAEYLKSLEPGRLLSKFREVAGLEPKAKNYGGWEDEELRGHTLGHYLSANSMMYAATDDTVFKNTVDYIVDELKKCQEAYGTGYVSAFPESFIDRVEATEDVWAPYYTIHKIMAGLFDSYKYAGNNLAKNVLKNMADWVYERCNKLSHSSMQTMLDSTEQGGMNDVLYNLYDITGNEKYFELARMFYQESYFKPLAKYRDSLTGYHVNSFIPNVIGVARDYELSGDLTKKQIAKYFWNQVTEARSFVTGGTSSGEHWGTEPYHRKESLGESTHETCCTYNMLKLTKHLFKWEPSAEYMDYYERALWNGILPTQDPETGMMMYYVGMESGSYKTFNTPENSFWCCTGTGMENWAKTGGDIYFSGNNSLYVNQFISSKLESPNGFTLVQKTDFPKKPSTKLKVISNNPYKFDLRIRIPGWIDSSATIHLNGEKINKSSDPSSYFVISRTWEKGDQVKINFPMGFELERMPIEKSTAAVKYGPIVLAGVLGDKGLDEDIVFGEYGPFEAEPIKSPDIQYSKDDGEFSELFNKTNHKHLNFKMMTQNKDSILVKPFYELFDNRYAIYWELEND